MQMFTAKCPACNGVYDGRITSRFVTCEYCGTRFALTKDELDALGFVDADGDGFDDNDVPTAASADMDESSATMPEFAREACQAFLNGTDKSRFTSSDKILRGLDIKAGDDVYLIHDDTMFKSGKNGFAITRDGMYCREFGDRTAHFVSWEDLANGAKPELDEYSYIRQNGISLCYFSDDDDLLEGKIIKLYQRLYNHACKVA